jgi:Na+/proline symporter
MIGGLHWLDWVVIGAYVVGILLVGQVLARQVRGESDFFLAGRKLGRGFQFFLNFGNMTDPATAAATTSSVYQQGASGVWLGLIALFLTPYYWFMNVWFRRVRLVTIADLFEDRFGGRFLPVLYAITNILVSLLAISFTDIVTLKTLQPIITKPEVAWTASERASVADYREFLLLKSQLKLHDASEAERSRYATLQELYSRNEIGPVISYLHPAPFYFATSGIIAIFVILGGLKASAMVDALQAVLIVTMSVILIPFGLVKIGGMTGLHERVPAPLFDMFGVGATNQYTWYSITAFLLVAFIGINAAYGNMSISGSARNELAARVGAIGGGFGKRLMTIAWCFCGLVAVALFRPALADPDQSWGLLTKTLLPMGLVGVMIVGILGGSVAHLSANGIVVAALVVKNLYTPLVPDRSEAHYMKVARLTVAIVLALGAVLALCFRSATALLIFMITLGVAWGGPILLIFLWRRLTEKAVRVSVITTLVVIGVIPWTVSAVPALRRIPALTAVAATSFGNATEKVSEASSGRSRHTPQMDGMALYFEGGVARINPRDPDSPVEGLGRFNIEVYLLTLVGLDLTHLTPAMLLTLRCLVDAFLPLLLLIGLSYVTSPTESHRVSRFYAKLKVPVRSDSRDDAAAVSAAMAEPSALDQHKLFPRSSWEFTRWNRLDTYGFLGCCAFVFVILGAFRLLLAWGRA